MSLSQILVTVAIIGYVIVRRFAGQPLTARSLTLPLILTGYGLVQLHGVHLSAVDICLIGVELVTGLALGGARGLTIRIFERDGHLWQRYGWATLGIWLLSIGLRIVLAMGGHLVGADLATGPTIMATLGASMIAESAVVGLRAARTGLPFAPSKSQRAPSRI